VGHGFAGRVTRSGGRTGSATLSYAADLGLGAPDGHRMPDGDRARLADLVDARREWRGRFFASAF
jgi:hypothetical protein